MAVNSQLRLVEYYDPVDHPANLTAELGVDVEGSCNDPGLTAEGPDACFGTGCPDL